MKIFLPQNCSPEKLKKLLIHEAGGHGLVSLPVDSCQEERFMEQLSSLCGGFSGTLDKDFETQVIESFQGSCKSIGTSLHAAGLGVQTGEKQERLTGGAWSAFAANAAGIEDAVQVQQAAVAAVPRDLDSVKPLALATLANSPVYTTTGRAVPEDGKSYQIVETPEVRRAFDDVERYSQNNVIRPLNTAFGTLNRAEANPRPLAAANTAVGQQQRAQLVENAKELAATRADALAAVGASGTVAELRQAVLSDLLPRATGTSNPAGLAMNAATLARDASLRNSGAVVASGNGSVALGKMDSSNEVGSNVAAGVNAGGAAIASGKMDSSQGLAAQPAATSPGARVPASAISQTAGVAAGRAQNSGQSSGSGGGGQNTSSRAMAVASVLGSPSVQRVEGQTYSAAIELHSKDPDEFRRALDAKNVRLFFKPRGANKVIEFGSKDPKARQLIENGNALELKK